MARRTKATPQARTKAAQDVLDQVARAVDKFADAIAAREQAEKALDAAYAAEEAAKAEAATSALVSPAILQALQATPRRFEPHRPEPSTQTPNQNEPHEISS